MSDSPNRRATGLDLLRKAADPEKAVGRRSRDRASAAELRNLAVEFLAIRDVEPMPEFPTGPTRGIEFGPGGAMLAALSEDGQEISLWNVGSGSGSKPSHWATAPSLLPHRPAGAAGDASAPGGDRGAGPRRRMQSGSPPRPGPGGPGGGPRGEGRRSGAGGTAWRSRGTSWWRSGPTTRRLRLFDVRTGSLLRDMVRDGRRIQGVMASPESERLLTIEAVAGPVAARTASTPRGPDFFSWNGEIEVNLWDVNRLEEPIKTAGTSEARTLRGRASPWPPSAPTARRSPSRSAGGPP